MMITRWRLIFIIFPCDFQRRNSFRLERKWGIFFQKNFWFYLIWIRTRCPIDDCSIFPLTNRFFRSILSNKNMIYSYIWPSFMASRAWCPESVFNIFPFSSFRLSKSNYWAIFGWLLFRMILIGRGQNRSCIIMSNSCIKTVNTLCSGLKRKCWSWSKFWGKWAHQ